MLQASSERPLPAGSLWVPGMSPQLAADGSPSARAREIARRRDEMLGMLRGLPEAEYELSLTDLVEKTTGAVAMPPLPPQTPTQPTERKEAGPSQLGMPAARSESGRQTEQQQPAALASRKGSSRRRGDSGGGSGRSSFRSSSDGVLLNFYMPRVISRSFTAPRPGAHHAPSAARAAAVVVPDDSNKRERDSDTVKCWPMPWDRRWRKSSRRDQAGESASILNNAAPQENV